MICHKIHMIQYIATYKNMLRDKTIIYFSHFIIKFNITFKVSNDIYSYNYVKPLIPYLNYNYILFKYCKISIISLELFFYNLFILIF